MRQAAAARRSARLRALVWLIGALLLAAHRSPAVPVAATWTAASFGSSSRDGSHEPFRLGTAGRPFAWSTAVGDLNADGRADYAVADRVGRRASGAEYSVEFSISGVGSRSVSFDAPDEALAVSLRDVDHDHDLDLVVTALLSRAVVGVWLNDGHGRFEQAASIPAFTEWQAGPSQADDVGTRNVDAATETTPRRLGDGVDADVVAAAVFAPLDRLTAGDRFAARLRPSAHLRSRAPPSATLRPV